MAKDQPSRKKEATGKSSNRGSGKKSKTATPKAVRKATKSDKIVVSKQEINEQRLKRDEEYYRSIHGKQAEKAAKKVARYSPRLYTPDKPEIVRDYLTETGSGRLTREKYQALVESQYSLPNYPPIRDASTGKLKGYYNEVSGERVSEYYYRNVFRKRFVDQGSEAEQRAYNKNIVRRKIKRDTRVDDLANSYRWVHPDMTRQQILRDPTFRALVKKANYWTAMQASFTPDYAHNIGMAMSEYLSLQDVSDEQLTDALKTAVGSEEDYIETMKLLGRKLPDDNAPIGKSPEQYMSAVFAYYMALNNSADYEEDKPSE